MADFSISSVSMVDLTAECGKLGVPPKLVQGGDIYKIGDYLSDHNLLAQVQKDLGSGQSQDSTNTSNPQNAQGDSQDPQSASQDPQQKLNCLA